MVEPQHREKMPSSTSERTSVRPPTLQEAHARLDDLEARTHTMQVEIDRHGMLLGDPPDAKTHPPHPGTGVLGIISKIGVVLGEPPDQLQDPPKKGTGAVGLLHTLAEERTNSAKSNELWRKRFALLAAGVAFIGGVIAILDRVGIFRR